MVLDPRLIQRFSGLGKRDTPVFDRDAAQRFALADPAAALNGPDSVIEEARNVYRKRRDIMVDSFARVGWDVPAPAATMFAWAPIPEPLKHLGSLEFAKQLIEHADVAVSPGVGFGEYGDGYVRIALVENDQRIRQAARNIRKFLSKHLDD